MQKYSWVFLYLSLFVFGGCQQEDRKVAPKEVATQTPVQFFPVTDFILGQLRDIDELPITPLKINIHGEHRDSTWMKREDLRRLAHPFLHPVIDSLSMIRYFDGKSFLDQTINAFTFSYDAKATLPDSIDLTHWDVYIDPQKNYVQRVYMVKEDKLNETPVTTQLTWKTDKWFNIRTIVHSPGKEPQVKEEILKWDFNEE